MWLVSMRSGTEVCNITYEIWCSPYGLKIMVFQDATSCGLVRRFEDCGVLGERHHVFFWCVGVKIMVFRLWHHVVWYVGLKVMVFWDVIPCFFVYRCQDYGVPGCDTTWFDMLVSILWCFGIWYRVFWYVGINIMVFWYETPCGLVHRYQDCGVLGCCAMWFYR